VDEQPEDRLLALLQTRAGQLQNDRPNHRQIPAAGGEAADRDAQLLAGRRFAEQAGRPGRDRRNRERLAGEGGVEEDLRWRRRLAEAPGDPEAVAIAEVIVDDRHIAAAAGPGDGRDRAARLSGQRHVRLVGDEPDEPGAHRNVVIDDQHADGAIRRPGACGVPGCRRNAGAVGARFGHGNRIGPRAGTGNGVQAPLAGATPCRRRLRVRRGPAGSRTG
jgi:hypothetical protein